MLKLSHLWLVGSNSDSWILLNKALVVFKIKKEMKKFLKDLRDSDGYRKTKKIQYMYESNV